MAAAKKTAAGGSRKRAPAKARAAVAEVAPEPEAKRVEFRGLQLELPDKLPKTFMWDLAAARNDDLAYYDLVQSLLRDEQLPLVRRALAEYEDGTDEDFLFELTNAIFALYGLGDVGEASASQDS